MNIEHRTSNVQRRMKKNPAKDLIRRVTNICCTSVDDAKISIQSHSDLFLLDLCLLYEVQHEKRITMIRNLKSRIKKLEKI